MGTKASAFAKKPLAAAIGALAVPTAGLLLVQPAVAQTTPTERATNEVLELLVVTATRRTESVQDVPFNIEAIGAAKIEQQGLQDLTQLSNWVPGLYVVNQGSRAADLIVIRGINADPSQASEALGNSGGNTVATYVGEIPLYVNLQLNDIQRVEVLMGPQGTLYGAGTLAGAIRYIPNEPEFDSTQVIVRGEGYTYSESDDPGGQVGMTVNWPISDSLAVRGSIDYLDDPGFIDYKYLVREAGVSNPDPDFTDPADVSANLKTKKDVNDEQTTSGRVALRWQPNDRFDSTLTYYFQNTDTGGRQINHKDTFAALDDYDSALRFVEPNSRDNALLALELTADLGFAELTSATGYSQYNENGQRDQTDLLISLEYSYEAFPDFSAYTQEDWNEETFTQEIRLVSTSEGRFGWIGGAFYNKQDYESKSWEFTPNYDLFAVAEFGGVQPRPDSLEYYSVSKVDLKETAVYGELSYDVTEDWQVTVGGRWYDYQLDTRDAVDFPLYYTVFVGDRGPDEIILDFLKGDQSDSGFLFKFNTSYHFTQDMMGYLTISEGYRLGGTNGVPLCPPNVPPGQFACALPNERFYDNDETTNYELGLRTEWLDQTLRINGSVYYIKWDKPQLSSATQNALIPITVNGQEAESYGTELSFDWAINENWSIRGNYAYTKAELTDTAPNLVPTINPPGFQSTITYENGESGDRLPGSPENKGSFYLVYERPLSNGMTLELDYGMYAQSNVLTRTGDLGGGEKLDSYAVQNAAAHLHAANWTLTVYGNNIFDTYGETAARNTSNYIQTVPDINGDPVYMRRYYKNVIPPLQVGLRVSYEFER